jgi:4'-phosphopantetheinyl transferase EntD
MALFQEARPGLPFSLVPRLRLPHGHSGGVFLPRDVCDIPESAWARLHPDEQAFARDLPPRRRQTWVGGRLALRAALGCLGAGGGPLLRTARGAPALPPGFVGSISHKVGLLAVAVAARADGSGLGVDVERVHAAAEGFAGWVLAAEEHAQVAALPQAVRAREITLRFSLKEAVVKALDPLLGRLLALPEVSAVPGPDGAAAVRLRLRPGEGPFAVDACWRAWGRGVFLTSACARPQES